MAKEGMGLTQEQEFLVEEILSSARKMENRSYIVQGLPGSGKTLLAVTLLLRTLNEGLKCILAIRNNRLQAVLRNCFNASFPGASGLLIYFQVQRTGTGIGDEGFTGKFDLVICDEAQRMRSNIMTRVLGRTPVSAIFLDETQRLNPPEEGTILNFSKASTQIGKIPIVRYLSSPLRCRGGQPYQEWVENLLIPKPVAELLKSRQTWTKKYLFEVFQTAEELIDRITELRDADAERRVALIASFTESKGSYSRREHPENLRIGYPLSSGFDLYKDSPLNIYWLMKPNEYVNYWTRGRSNDLSQVASIYGAQGFESDIVGVFWGRDFIFREGEWCVGNPEFISDAVDGLKKSAGSNPKLALELLKNRYRIFLTRGIQGTLVFCEDEKTRELLHNIFINEIE